MKKLIVLAVAAAVVAPVAMADNSVQIYGSMRAAVESYKLENDSTVSGVSKLRVSDYESYIGFKGEEKLSGGLKAIWQVESGIAVDDNNGSTNNGSAAYATSTLASRDTFVGIAGDFGQIKLGRFQTPYKKIQLDTAPAMDAFYGKSALQLLGYGYGLDGFTNNAVQYDSPELAKGLKLKVAYVTDESRTNGATRTNSYGADLALEYTNGPAVLAYGYAERNDVALVSNNSALTTATTGTSALNGVHLKAHKLIGSYTVGDAVFGAAYERIGYSGLDSKDSTNYTGQVKQNRFVLSGEYAMGNIKLLGAYAKDGKFSGVASTNPDLGKANQVLVGLQYTLSKRTTALAQMSLTKWDKQGTDSAGNMVDRKERNLAVGIVHNF